MKKHKNLWCRLLSQAAFLSLLVNMIFPAGVAQAEAAPIGSLRTWENTMTETSATLAFSFSAAGYFRIDYGTAPGNYTVIGSSVSLTNTSYPYYSITVSGLSASTTYYYRLATKALSPSTAEWGYTAESSFTTAAPDTTPPAVSAVAASEVTATTANITFTSSEAGYAKIEYGPATTFGSYTGEVSVTAGSPTTIPLSGLSGGTTYSYHVVARDSTGNNTISSTYTLTTTTPPDTTPPSVSGGTIGNITSSSVSISFTTNEAGYAKVEYGTGGSFALSTGENSVTANTTSIIYIYGLASGTTYNYRVVVRDNANNITTTPPGYFATTSSSSTGTIPGAPSGLSTSGSTATTIGIYWTDNSNNETEFRIERRLNSGSWSQVGTVGASVTTYTDSISGAGTFEYRVKACNSSGCSAESNTVSRTMYSSAPATPSGLTSTYSSAGNSITVSWVDNSSDEWGFRVYRRALGTTAWLGVASVFNNYASSNVTYTDTYQLSANTTYEYIVRSYNTYESPDSNMATATPAGSSSSDLTLTSIWSSATLQDGVATIYFTANKSAYVKAQYSTDTSYSQTSGEVYSSGSTSWSLTISGLASATTYNYRLVARDASNAANTITSGTYNFTTKSYTTTGPAISGVHTMNVTSNSAQIMWSCDRSCYGQVSYSTSSNYSGFINTPWTTTLSSSPTVDLTGLAANTTYYIQANAKDSNGLSNYQAYSFTTSAGSSTATTTPISISGVYATNITANSSNVYFTLSESGYAKVQYGTNNVYNLVTGELYTSPNISSTIYLSGLTANTTYNYRVEARKISGTESAVTSPSYTFTTTSSSGTATTTPPTQTDTTPPVITGVHVMDNTSSLTQIMWSTDDQSYGKVEYGETASYGQFTSWTTSLSYSPTVDITAGLITGKTYHYRVYSRNQSGLEAVSNDYTFTTSSTTTPPPTTAFSVDTSRLEPRSGATEVPLSLSKIHVEFTKAVDSGSITGSAVALNYLGATGTSLPGSFDFFSNGFNFILPLNSLKPGLTYNFTIRGTVRASTGETLASDYVFSFTTAKTSETTGQATIKGTVKSSAGTPVAGAYVSLRSSSYYGGSYSQSTQTTAYGEYYFANLAVGTYTLEVYPPSSSGGITRPDPVSVTLAAGDTVIRDFTLTSSNKYIKGTVKFSDGTPVTDAEVSAYRREGNGWVSGATDTTGTFSLAVQTGSWMVSIRPRSMPIAFNSVTYQPITYPTWIYTNPPQEVYIDESITSKEVNFTVPRQGATVSGNLARADGGFLSSGAAMVRFLGQAGFSVSATVDLTGRFTTPINPGTYKLFVDVFDPDLAGPEWPPISIAPGETRDLGTIYLKNLEAVVSGRVTTIDGQGVPRVKVSGWKMNSAESNSAITDQKGEYTMKVSPGDWTLSITPSPDQPYSTTAPPQTIRVKGGRLTGINFVLTASDGLVNGVVTDGRGNILSDFYGFVSVSSRAGGYRLPHGAPVERGQFTLRLPSGSYLLYLELPPNAVSGKPAPVPITVGSGESRKVEFVIKEEASGAIIGFLVDRAGNKIINVPFKVFATGASGGWYSALVDLALGYYKLNLPAGSWYLDYDLDDDTGQYQRPFDRKRKITVRAGQIVNLDLPVLEQNGRISGIVRDTEGNGLPNIWVAISSQPFSNFNRATATNQRYLNGITSDEAGQFSLPVLPGRYYVRAFVPPALGFTNPEEQNVNVAGGDEVEVELILRSSATTISGQTTIAGVPSWAFVWAWSNKGGYTESYADENGGFKLKVAANDVWHVGAMSELNRDTYKASEVAITVSRPGVNIPLNLDLAPLGVKLPEPVSVASEAEQMTVVANDNGARLVMPANAASTEGSLSVSIAPAVITPSQGADKVVGVGYEMEVRNAQGQEVNTFNSELTVSIPYDPKELTRLNLRPADLGLRYWDEVSSTWREVSNAIVDEINHVITASLAHLTRFAIVAASDTTPPSAPSQVKTKILSDGVVITWVKPQDKDLQYVKIYRSTTKDALGEVVANNLTAATYKDSGLKRGATYYYLARAVDLSGNESTNTSSAAVGVKGSGTLGKATARGVVTKLEKITLKGSITDVNLAASTLEIKVETSSVKDLKGKKVVVKFTPQTKFTKDGKAVKAGEVKASNNISVQANREGTVITLVSATVTTIKVKVKAQLKVSRSTPLRGQIKVRVFEPRGVVAGMGIKRGQDATFNVEGVSVNTNGQATPVENLVPQDNVIIEGVVENGSVTVTKITTPETPKVKVQPTPQGRIGDEAASVAR